VMASWLPCVKWRRLWVVAPHSRTSRAHVAGALSSVTDAFGVQDLLPLEVIPFAGSRPVVWGILDRRK
jgi:hypothetical protein